MTARAAIAPPLSLAASGALSVKPTMRLQRHDAQDHADHQDGQSDDLDGKVRSQAADAKRLRSIWVAPAVMVRPATASSPPLLRGGRGWLADKRP